MAHRITFVVDAFDGANEKPRSHAVLRRLLAALFEIDCLWLVEHPETPRLYEAYQRGLVCYQEEPPGAEDWQDIPTCLALGWADCEDMACWLAAERCVRDKLNARPDFTCQVQPDGTHLYHIITKVTHPDGTTEVEDPSRVTGMR